MLLKAFFLCVKTFAFIFLSKTMAIIAQDTKVVLHDSTDGLLERFLIECRK